MYNTSNNEVILIGTMCSYAQKIQACNHKACKVRIKVTDENNSINIIPVIFLNPDKKKLKECINKTLCIIGHIETKWALRIIVDAYKTEDEDSVQLIINSSSH